MYIWQIAFGLDCQIATLYDSVLLNKQDKVYRNNNYALLVIFASKKCTIYWPQHFKDKI